MLPPPGPSSSANALPVAADAARDPSSAEVASAGGADAGVVRATCVVLGGGVAGLWILARLRAAGISSLLVESQALGSGQTIASQGIIHGGTKYALDGVWSRSAQAVAAMPARWNAALQGEGEVDLRGTRVLAPHQSFWTTGGLASGVTAFVAGNLVRGRMERVPETTRPEVFRHPAFRGEVYRLDEPVLDMPSLLTALRRAAAGALVHGQPEVETTAPQDGPLVVRVRLADGRMGRIQTERVVLAAGAGNEALLQPWVQRVTSAGGAGTGGHVSEPTNPDAEPATQRRPLQMAMVRAPGLPGGLYAHCFGAGSTPRVTITSHPVQPAEEASGAAPDGAAAGRREGGGPAGDGRGASGGVVWYIGGEVAERGVERSREEQIAAVRAELHLLLPWVDFAAAEWSTLRVDRAEPWNRGKRPNSAVVRAVAPRVFAAWPTKLALAPHLADEVLVALAGNRALQCDDAAPRGAAATALAAVPDGWPVPPVAPAPWHEGDRLWTPDASVR